MTGAIATFAGRSAEQAVADKYRDDGFLLRDRNYRRRGGEIDLVMSDSDQLVFVEVKKAKDFETAATRIVPAQKKRLTNMALRYLSTMPEGLNTSCRFDVALVDAVGRIAVVPNAFA